MATNANTAAQWQQAKDSLAAQNTALLDTYTQLDSQKGSLISKAGDLSKQINNATDPAQKAQLQAEHASIMSEVKQVNSQIAQTNTSLQQNGDQLATANQQLNTAANGPANLNSTTPPVGSDTTTPTPAVSPEKTVASDLSSVKQSDGTYLVVNNKTGVELYSSDTPNGANTYMSSVANGRSHQDAVGNANIVEANPTAQQTVEQTAQPFGSGPPDTTLLSNSPKTPTGDPSTDSEAARVQDLLDGKTPASDQKTPTEPTASDTTAQTSEKTSSQSDVAEDPMAAALAANQASNEETSPTEQTVVNASQDAALSASDKAALEEQQAANRAALQQEDLTNSTANLLVKPGQALSSANAITAIPDWRVKLSLAKSASYLYTDPSCKQGDILFPLKQSGGVVFPYTPQINTAYRASYDATDLTHSNYRMHFYKSSHVDDIQITCDFTAQDSSEASYILAVIHFFKSVTKMFYGKDTAPVAGTPPPLVYLSGYGQYQFNNHPMLISSFTYNLPNDVDYIRASTGSVVSVTTGAGTPVASNSSYIPGLDFIKSRLLGAKLNKGGATSQPTFTLRASGEPTYVPTKIQIQLTCLPVVTRNDISNNFSLNDYAKGNLTKRSTGGIW